MTATNPESLLLLAIKGLANTDDGCFCTVVVIVELTVMVTVTMEGASSSEGFLEERAVAVTVVADPEISEAVIIEAVMSEAMLERVTWEDFAAEVELTYMGVVLLPHVPKPAWQPFPQ